MTFRNFFERLVEWTEPEVEFATVAFPADATEYDVFA